MALLLLKDAGRKVSGVHAFFRAPAPVDLALAEQLVEQCAGLGLSCQVLDLHEEFEQRVIEPFIGAYRHGLTPNPCAACNRDMKFGLLLDEARRLGANLATGHYAGLGELPGQIGPFLTKAADPLKDQSYFLALVPRGRFAAVEFPLAGWSKAEVLACLRERGLPPLTAGESQDVCFIPEGDYRAFMRARGVELPGGGDIVDRQGRVLGRHRGLWAHTQGQRRGLGLAHSQALYVLDKDMRANRLVVGGRAEACTDICRVGWINYHLAPDQWPDTVLVKLRYRQREVATTVETLPDGALVFHMQTPVAITAPGQIAVVYSVGGQVLAGGHIL